MPALRLSLRRKLSPLMLTMIEWCRMRSSIATLGKALVEGKLDERLKLLTQPQLLICDEIGYLPIDRQGANLFFQLVSRRYERGSIIITSNQSLGAWGECQVRGLSNELPTNAAALVRTANRRVENKGVLRPRRR
jgi:DNA replication protein DnaC